MILWTCCSILLLLILGFVCFPYQALQVLVFILRYTCYRANVWGQERVPSHGPALLVANHISLFDALILMALTRRHIRFMIHEQFYRKKYLNWLFRRCKVIEVPNAGKAKQMQHFVKEVRQILQDGNLVCMFPEGGVSGNGLILRFKKGIARLIPDNTDIPVIPISVGILWGSLFSLDKNQKMHFTFPRQFPMPILVHVGNPVSRNITPFQLRQKISELSAEIEMDRHQSERPVHYAFARLTKWKPFINNFRDFKGAAPSNLEILTKALILSRLIRQLDAENPSKYVGVLLPNCTNAAAVLYAVLFADRIPAVLNFSVSPSTRAICVKNAQINITLTSRKFIEKLGVEATPDMVFLEDVAKNVTPGLKRKVLLDILLLPTSFLVRKYSPKSWNDLSRECVLLFSSGSTGIPKGVMLTHHNVNSNFFSFWRVINWKPTDRVVGNLPLFHAYGFIVGFVIQSYVPTRVIYLPNPLDAAGVCSLCETEKPTLMMATPTFLQHYMRKYRPNQFESLRLVITGAEKLRKDISDSFQKMTGLTITEGFGCTETSPIVAVNFSFSLWELGVKAGIANSVGAPLPGIHVKIVDPETLEELPENTPGLMLVKGGNVMKGYLNEPQKTADVLKNGYYNTGDIAKMNPDGYLTITGRLSRFSKIAGEMVPHELIELTISEILCAEERVVAVCGAKDEKRGERLCVFYSSDRLVPEEIIEELKKRDLPNLWIPKSSDFVSLDKIPLLGSGKLDLQTLKNMAEKL